MALADNKGYFWNSERGDRKYDAGSFEKWLKKFFTSGVFANELYTTATTGMGISVSSGYCNCDGKVRLFESPSTFTIATAGATNPRIDTVVIERNDANREITMKIVQGAYAENPVATAPVREGGIYQLVLAEIYVGAGVSTITQANITDKRTDSTVCGYVTGTVTEISWAQITSQWETYIAQFKATREADFDAWVLETKGDYNSWVTESEGDYNEWIAENEADFLAWYDRMKDQLSEDAAGHLQAEIDALELQVDDEIDDLEKRKQNNEAFVSYNILATGWDNGVYSLETDYPSTDYDIVGIYPNANTTEDMLEAWQGAQVYGYEPTNVIRARGDVPAIDITMTLAVRYKSPNAYVPEPV